MSRNRDVELYNARQIQMREFLIENGYQAFHESSKHGDSPRSLPILVEKTLAKRILKDLEKRPEFFIFEHISHSYSLINITLGSFNNSDSETFNRIIQKTLQGDYGFSSEEMRRYLSVLTVTSLCEFTVETANVIMRSLIEHGNSSNKYSFGEQYKPIFFVEGIDQGLVEHFAMEYCKTLGINIASPCFSHKFLQEWNAKVYKEQRNDTALEVLFNSESSKEELDKAIIASSEGYALVYTSRYQMLKAPEELYEYLWETLFTMIGWDEKMNNSKVDAIAQFLLRNEYTPRHILEKVYHTGQWNNEFYANYPEINRKYFKKMSTHTLFDVLEVVSDTELLDWNIDTNFADLDFLAREFMKSPSITMETTMRILKKEPEAIEYFNFSNPNYSEAFCFYFEFHYLYEVYTIEEKTDFRIRVRNYAQSHLNTNVEGYPLAYLVKILSLDLPL